LEVDFNMAQAFEIPRGNRTAHNSRPAKRQSAIAELPATPLQIAVPGPTQRLDRQEEYGPTFGPLQARKRGSRATSAGPIPG